MVKRLILKMKMPYPLVTSSIGKEKKNLTFDFID